MHSTRYRIGGKFYQEKIFANFADFSRWRNFIHDFFVLCYDYIEDMVTFTALAKLIPSSISATQRYLGLAKLV